MKTLKIIARWLAGLSTARLIIITAYTIGGLMCLIEFFHTWRGAMLALAAFAFLGILRVTEKP